jgi:hypothetical protein
MNGLPAGPGDEMQRDDEWASKTCAACTVAAVHEYITLTVQVTCHSEWPKCWVFEAQTR